MKRLFIPLIIMLICLVMAGGALAQAYIGGSIPIAESFEIITVQNKSAGGYLQAHDPDGGELLYTISTKPVKGEIRISGGGMYLYTPDENRWGKDYFGYKVIDRDGNVSQEATVIIRIEKRKRILKPAFSMPAFYV